MSAVSHVTVIQSLTVMHDVLSLSVPGVTDGPDLRACCRPATPAPAAHHHHYHHHLRTFSMSDAATIMMMSDAATTAALATALARTTDALARLSSATHALATAPATTRTAAALMSLGAVLAVGCSYASSSSSSSSSSPAEKTGIVDDTPADRCSNTSGEAARELQQEVGALRQMLDDELDTPPVSQLLSEVEQLKAELAVARGSSKKAWKARADDWVAFETERVQARQVLSDAATAAKAARQQATSAAEAAAGAPAAVPQPGTHALELKLVPSADDLDCTATDEVKGSPSCAVTIEQVNSAIRMILSPDVPIVQGVLSPRQGAFDASSDGVAPKRKARNWSRHRTTNSSLRGTGQLSTGVHITVV